MYDRLVRRRILTSWEALSNHEIDGLPLADDVRFTFAGEHGLAMDAHSAAEEREWLRALFVRFPRVRFEVDDVVIGGPAVGDARRDPLSRCSGRRDALPRRALRPHARRSHHRRGRPARYAGHRADRPLTGAAPRNVHVPKPRARSHGNAFEDAHLLRPNPSVNVVFTRNCGAAASSPVRL